MKRFFITTIMLCVSLVIFAQTTPTTEVVQSVPLTQKGFKILPEKGDFALGIDASPFLKFVGNMFNGTLDQNSPSFDGARSPLLDKITIYGKYFLENDRAVRARLTVNSGYDVHKGTVIDDYAATQPGYNGQTGIDVWKASSTGVALSAGYEFRRGYRRLQGFYGGEFGLAFSSGGKDAYTYANAITSANQTPTTSDFNGGSIAAVARTTEVNYGNSFGLMLNGFVGVEYFVASKLSIGGELGLSFNGWNRWQDETTYEYWSTTEGQRKENTVRSLDGTTGGFHFQTLPTGSIFVMFHF